MNGGLALPGEWTRTRWALMLLGVMGLQVGLIFALGERTPPKPRVAVSWQSLQITATRTEFQELQDPTLFARPHARDFSARRWLHGTPPNYPVFRWTEPTRPLELPLQQLGTVLNQFLRTNLFAAFSLEARPTPEILTRRPDDIAEAFPAQSKLLIQGALATRQLLNPPELPPQPADDLLTNSVVQVLVDAAGHVFSAVLLGAERLSGGSGSAEADRLALERARQLQFAPHAPQNWLASPAAELTRGWLIFEWRTVPSTNGAAVRSNPP